MDKFQSEPWKEITDEELESGAELLKAEMTKGNVNKELIDEIINQLQETREENNNLIFLFTDSDWAVTAIHVPDEALNGERGPVLMRGAHPRSIIAAYAQSHVRNKLKMIDGLEIITGLNSENSDEAWIEVLQSMAQEVRIKMKENPPEMWEELLD